MTNFNPRRKRCDKCGHVLITKEQRAAAVLRQQERRLRQAKKDTLP